MAESTRRPAVFSIGSNSVRLLVAEWAGEGMTVLERGEVVTRLAGYRITPDGRAVLTQEAMAATLEAAAAFAKRARELGASLGGVVATEAVRAASNGPELTEALERELGAPVRLLSGEEEARLGWLAVASYLPDNWGAGIEAPIGVIDIGGGSTDLSAGFSGHDRPEAVLSLQAGGRTVMSRFGLQRPVERTTLMGLMASLNIELARRAAALRPRPERAVVIGGTASALAALRRKVSGDVAPGNELPLNDTWLDVQLKALSLLDVPGRIEAGAPPDRADILVAGAAILLTILQAWGLTECYTSDHNILDGYLRTLITENSVKNG